MRSFASKLVGLLAILISGAASAQDVEVSAPTVTRGQAWSVYSGYTLGAGNTVLAGQVGWPGISATVLHGVTSNFDIGGRFGFNYGLEGMVRQVVPGLRLQGVARINLLDQQRLGLALEFAPGPIFYFRRAFTQVGMTLPIKLSLGIPVGSAIMINAGLDVPMFVFFGTGSYLRHPAPVRRRDRVLREPGPRRHLQREDGADVPHERAQRGVRARSAAGHRLQVLGPTNAAPTSRPGAPSGSRRRASPGTRRSCRRSRSDRTA